MVTVTALILITLAIHQVAGGSGFKVSGTTILDGNGKPFLMRGINLPYIWYKKDLETGLAAIAKTGANTARVILADGDRWPRTSPEEVTQILSLCKKYKLVAVIDVHDLMETSDDETKLDNAVKFWVSIAGLLKGTENDVILNVANEYLHANDGVKWARVYKTALPRIRAAGLNHLLIVDGPGWAQYIPAISQHGLEVFQADPQRNTAFSLHMYESGGKDEATVRKNIDACLAIGVPLIIGEFSDAQHGKRVAYEEVMRYCDVKSVGWLAWSWFGNTGGNLNMDLATGPSGPLTKLGQRIVNGPNGIQHRGAAAAENNTNFGMMTLKSSPIKNAKSVHNRGHSRTHHKSKSHK